MYFSTCMWESLFVSVEHRCLTHSQFTRLHKPDRYVYSEKSLKNRQGGLYQAKMDHKTVTIVANPEVKERCPVLFIGFVHQ